MRCMSSEGSLITYQIAVGSPTCRTSLCTNFGACTNILFMPGTKQSARKKRRGAGTGRTSKRSRPEAPGTAGVSGKLAEPSLEVERVLRVVEALLPDLSNYKEPSTALLLYALLQTPSTAAYSLLGALPVDLRARLANEAWQSANVRNGVPVEHLRQAAAWIAE